MGKNGRYEQGEWHPKFPSTSCWTGENQARAGCRYRRGMNRLGKKCHTTENNGHTPAAPLPSPPPAPATTGRD